MRSTRRPRRVSPALAAVLAAAALGLAAGCGGEEAAPIPTRSARDIVTRLDEVERRVAADACNDVRQDSLPALEREVGELPERVDPAIRSTLEDGLGRLEELVQAECEEPAEEPAPEPDPAPEPTPQPETPIEPEPTPEPQLPEPTVPDTPQVPDGGGGDGGGGGGDGGGDGGNGGGGGGDDGGGTGSLPGGGGGSPQQGNGQSPGRGGGAARPAATRSADT
jgi:hypothetical protein